MRTIAIVAGLAAVAACSPPSSPPLSAARSRYQGLGAYAPGVLWARIAAARTPETPRSATPEDDEHVIVVVDGLTGEVRECGDYSGACVSLSPWAASLAKERAAPVALSAHLADVAHEDKEAVQPRP